MPSVEARQDVVEALQAVRDLSRALQDKTDELAVERQRSLDAFEYAPEALAITDAEGRIVAVNRACSELAGLPPPKLLGKRLTWLVRAPRLVATSFELGSGRCWRIRAAR